MRANELSEYPCVHYVAEPNGHGSRSAGSYALIPRLTFTAQRQPRCCLPPPLPRAPRPLLLQGTVCPSPLTRRMAFYPDHSAPFVALASGRIPRGLANWPGCAQPESLAQDKALFPCIPDNTTELYCPMVYPKTVYSINEADVVGHVDRVWTSLFGAEHSARLNLLSA